MRELVGAGLRRHAVHLQRLRAELAVARSRNAAPASRSRRGSRSPPRLVARRVRRAHHRHRPPARWQRPGQVVGTLRNFIPERMVRATGRMMRMNIDDGDIFIGEFANGALVLGANELRDGRELSRHRGAHLRQQGGAHLPAGRGARRLRDAQGRNRRRRSSSATCRFPSAFIRRAAARASRGARCSTPTSSGASSTKSCLGRQGNEGNFDEGAWVQEVINARGAIVPGAAMGEPAARVTRAAIAETRLPSVDRLSCSRSTPLGRFFEHYYAWRPVQATFTGVHDYDSRLPDWSPDGLDALVADMRDSPACAGRRRARSTDDHVRALSRRRGPRARRRVSRDPDRRAREPSLCYRNPALWTGEAIFGVIALVTREFAPLESRLEAAAARLRAIPAFLADARRVLRAAPVAWRARAVRECAAGAPLVSATACRAGGPAAQ